MAGQSNNRYGQRGSGIGGGSYTNGFVNSNLATGILTVSHNLDGKVSVSVYDNDGKLVIPDDVDLLSDNACEIDLTSYGTITGSWSYVILSSSATISANTAKVTSGVTAPTTSTVGNLGDVIFDINQVRYECTAINNGVYTWTIGVDRALTGQTAPTTATVGYLDQVVFDIDGNEWKCLNIPMTTWNQTANYIWALADKDVYPALNTEYVSHYCTRLSKIVYKMAKETTTHASGGPTLTAHGITGFSRCYDTPNVFIVDGVPESIGIFYLSGTSSFLGYINATNVVTQTPNASTFNAKTAYWKFTYIKS